MQTPEIAFRKYSPRDLEGCTDITLATWPVPDWLVDEGVKKQLIRSYVEFSIYDANWAEVAVDSGKIVGLLFGEIRDGPVKSFHPMTLLEGFLRIARTTSSGNRLATSMRMVASYIIGELKIALNLPKTGAYISLLIVSPEYRGMKIGRTLLERFSKDSIISGARQMSVYTEDAGSNWGFYEKHGFRRIASFQDSFTSFYYRKKATAMIYVLDLKVNES